MLAAFDAGADYVGTIRADDRTLVARLGVTLHQPIRERTTKIQMTDQGCMLRGYDRRIVDAINRCQEVTPFVPALAYTSPAVRSRSRSSMARAAGESKYSYLQLVRLNFDLMTGYSLVPLQLFTWLESSSPACRCSSCCTWPCAG